MTEEKPKYDAKALMESYKKAGLFVSALQDNDPKSDTRDLEVIRGAFAGLEAKLRESNEFDDLKKLIEPAIRSGEMSDYHKSVMGAYQESFFESLTELKYNDFVELYAEEVSTVDKDNLLKSDKTVGEILKAAEEKGAKKSDRALAVYINQMNSAILGKYQGKNRAAARDYLVRDAGDQYNVFLEKEKEEAEKTKVA